MSATSTRTGGAIPRRAACMLAVVIAAISAAPLAHSQTTETLSSATSEAPSLNYRRVFVPAERTSEWPTGGAQYLPIERAEFERLVEQTEERRQLSRPGGAHINAADYAARLTESDALEGVAVFNVQRVDDSPAVVALAPWNAVVLRGRWLSADAAVEPQSATIGLWPDAAGRLANYGLLADRTGQVEVDWQAVPAQRGAELEFVLQLPTALSQRLTLDLPAGATPTMPSGRLVEQTNAPQGPGRRWVFQLAGGVDHRLSIRRAGADEAEALPATKLPLVAVTEAYHLTPDGVDYEAELRVQNRGVSQTQLRLQAPPSLHIAAVAVNRQPVEWRRDPDDAAALLIPLPSQDEPAVDALATIAISGAASISLDAPWKLPSVTAQGLFWTEGTSTLWVDPTLEIRSLAPRECSLLNVVGVGNGDSGEVYRLQAWSPAASAELIVGDRRESLSRRSAIIAEFVDREIIALAHAEIRAAGGRVFHIAAPLADDWMVESVVAAPADAVVEWHVEEGDARKLHLQLRRSPTESLPLTLSVTARKPWRAWTRMASLSDLNFLQIPGDGQRNWLLVKDRRGNEIVPDAKLAEAIAPVASLDPADLELIGDASAGLLVDLNDANPNALVSVASTAVSFTGEAWMTLAASEAGYEHRAEILCRPATGALTELLILAARPLPADVAWELDAGQPATVERVTAPAASTSTATATTNPPPATGPVEYRLRLPQARTTPFRVRAAWRSAVPADAAVNVLSLPDAETWQAWAIFRGDARQVAVDPRGAAAAFALPQQTASRDDQLPAIACYRLGDDPTSSPPSPPTFVRQVVASADASVRGIVAWRCDVETQQFADGTQNHRLVYQLEASQPTDVQLEAPPNAKFAAIALDGRPLVAAAAVKASTVTVRIPGASYRQLLTVTLERKAAPLARVASIEPPLPKTSFPVMRGEWTLRWPAAYDAATRGELERDAVADAEPANWLARLGGPLSGHAGQRWYDGMLLAHVDAASPIVPASESGIATPGGWSRLTQSFVDQPLPVELRLASAQQANWHVVWLAAAVGGAWLWARSRRAVLLLIGAVAAICLIVPEPFIPLPQATFLGLITGAFVRQFVRFLTKSRKNSSAPASAVAAVVLVSLSSVLPWATSFAHAQAPLAPQLLAEASTPTPRPASAVAALEKIPQQVLFPVDDAGQPAGADVYVPAPLAAELLPAAEHGPAAALIDARYQIELQPSGASGEIAARRVQLRFRWLSRQPQARIELPLIAAEGAIDPASLLLNGQPILPEWNAAATALIVTLPRPGAHELTAAVTPLAAAPAAGEAQRGRLQLHIPPLAGAAVEVLHPAGLVDVRTVAAVTAPNQSNAARTTFHLGPANLLDVTWPARLEREAAGATVEQLSWLEVDPAGARLEVRLRISGDAAAISALRLVASPQLKLLPLPEGSPLELAPAGPIDFNAPGAVALRFRSPPTLPLAVSLQFQLQRTLSVGRIDYPWVDVLGTNVRSRHFAVSADPRLRIRDAALSGLTPVTPAELEPLWGPAVAAAALQYAAATATPDWSLDVAPVPSRFTSRESLELRGSEQEVRVAYSAAIADVAGELLVHRFVVSPDLLVDRVVATLDGPEGELPLRWARPQPDQLHVFLSRPLSEPHLVRIEGRLNEALTAALAPGAAADAGLLPAVERAVQIPRIALESSPAAPIDVALFRTGDVLIDWAAAPPAQKPATGSLDPAKGLFVGQFTVSRGDVALPELKITPNDSQYEADALLTMELEAAEPIAQCRLQGRATRGMVDHIQMIVDKNWRGPFTCEPAAQVASRDLAADSDRQTLDVRLARPIPAGEAFSLAVRGPVSLEADQRIRFPALRLANAQRQRIYLVQPPTAGNLTAEWTLRGLQSEPLPESLAAGLNLPPAAPTFRVDRERFVAEQRVFPDAMRSAVYRLAETRVAVDAAGNATALALLIVQAGGGEQCRITFPSGAKLEYAAVDGAPQHQLPAADVPWQAPVGSRYLPRVFLFSYRLPTFAPHGSRRFEPPQVAIDGKPLAPQTSLWQIAANATETQSIADGKHLAAVEFAAATRGEQIDAFLDAYPLASQLAEWELEQWRQPWLDRLNADSAAANDPAAWTRLRDRLAATTPSDRVVTLDPVRQWSEDVGVAAASFQGDADGVVTLQPRAASWPIARWLAALTLAAVVGVAWRQPAALRSLTLPMKRWPYVALGVAGLLWWYYLSPSLVGLLIIAFAIAAYRKSRR